MAEQRLLTSREKAAELGIGLAKLRALARAGAVTQLKLGYRTVRYFPIALDRPTSGNG